MVLNWFNHNLKFVLLFEIHHFLIRIQIHHLTPLIPSHSVLRFVSRHRATKVSAILNKIIKGVNRRQLEAASRVETSE